MAAVLFIVPILFATIAVSALNKGGLVRLWLACGLALPSMVLTALLVAKLYSAPSTWPVIWGLLAFPGPPILLTTICLSIAHAFSTHRAIQLAVAFGATVTGLVLGFSLAMYLTY